MISIQKLPLATHYAMTLPYRWWHNCAPRAGRTPIVVLFYHRIADDGAGPWTLSNRAFQRQMTWLQKRFDMISLEEAQIRLRSGFNSRPAVSITFDDGYADNCDQAIPFLLSKRIPCTYFATSRNAQRGLQFPHDRKLGLASRPNTINELRQMAAAGIEIGSHTRTHADLGQIHNPEQLFDEVVVSGEELQQEVGCSIRYFAFPFGLPANLNRDAFQLAYEHGYDGVCSAYGGYNFPSQDAFHIERCHAEDLVRMKNWVTVDPRKTFRPYHFDYSSEVKPSDAAGVVHT